MMLLPIDQHPADPGLLSAVLIYSLSLSFKMVGSVTFTGSSCQQNIRSGHNTSTIPAPLFPSKQTGPVPFLCYQGHKISRLQSHDDNKMGLAVGGAGKRKIGGLAAAAGTGSEAEEPIDKENIGGVLDEDVYEEPKHGKSAGTLKITLNKRRLSSVTECGEIEDMAENGDRLTLALNWFKNNYYEHPTGSVSRSDLYEKYSSMCMMMQSEPMNMATLGKHLRNLFPGIITRRLGNRGNSRYHYYGMAEIGVAIEEAPEGISSQVPLRRRRKKDLPKQRKSARNDEDSDYSEEDEPRPFRPIALRSTVNTTMDFLQCSPNHLDYAEFLRLQQEICGYAVGEGPSENFNRFATSYQNHTADILQKLIERDFASIEGLIQAFWTGLDEITYDTVLDTEEAMRLVSVADDYLYQVGICVLMPDAVEPCPLACLQSIRVFSKSFEHWFTSISPVTGAPIIFGDHIQLPSRLVDAKIDLAKRFSMILRRRTSVNHLAQAMHSVVNNKAQVQQMIHDWDHIDFASIRDQTKWVFGSKEPFVSYSNTLSPSSHAF